MTGEFYFMALGGLGVSLAGFAGLIAALDRRPSGSEAVARWRIQNIVIESFVLTFIGFGTIAVYTVVLPMMPSDSEAAALTARVMSMVIATYVAAHTYLANRPGPAWSNEAHRRRAVRGNLVFSLVALGNVVIGRVGYLELLMLVVLAFPVSIFIFAVRDLGRGGREGHDVEAT